jgi:hypothetical protein
MPMVMERHVNGMGPQAGGYGPLLVQRWWLGEQWHVVEWEITGWCQVHKGLPSTMNSQKMAKPTKSLIAPPPFCCWQG